MMATKTAAATLAAATLPAFLAWLLLAYLASFAPHRPRRSPLAAPAAPARTLPRLWASPPRSSSPAVSASLPASPLKKLKRRLGLHAAAAAASASARHVRAAASKEGAKGDDMLSRHYDLLIIGGGPTGCAAAEKAAYGGRETMVVDDPGSGAKLQLGGPTGLFSKALRDTAARVDVALLKAMGMSDKSIWSQVQDMCKEIALVETQNTVRRLRGVAVPRVQAKAAFTSPNTVELQLRNGKTVPVAADKFLIATGSSAFQAEGIPFDARRVFNSDSIKELSYLPSSVAITGAGIIAIEYAKIFTKLGAKVTLIVRDESFNAAMERVGIDSDIATALKDDLLESGVNLRFSTVVGDFNVPPSLSKPIEIQLRDRQRNRPTGETLEVDTYLFAAGRNPNTQGLGLEAAGVMVDERGRVLVDENLMTSVPGVYAAGDVLGPPGLASTGIEQGAAAVGHMFDKKSEAEADSRRESGFDPKSYLSDPDRFPVGIWTSPEVAYIGLTKRNAEAKDIEAIEGVAKYSDTTRGRVSRSRGILKLVVDGGERDLPVIGVSIFGEDACELVHYGMELVQSRRPLRKVLEASHAAVTYHELYKVAASAIDESLEFSVAMRSAFDLTTLRDARSRFQEALQQQSVAGKIARTPQRSVTKTQTQIMMAATIPALEAEEIAAELGLMDSIPLEDKTTSEELTYKQFLEYLRNVHNRNTLEDSGSKSTEDTGTPLVA